MKELTMEQLTVVNGGSDDIAGCKAAYWGMNGGKAGGGFIGGTGYAAGSAAAWAALGCEKIDNIYEKMKIITLLQIPLRLKFSNQNRTGINP